MKTKYSTLWVALGLLSTTVAMAQIQPDLLTYDDEPLPFSTAEDASIPLIEGFSPPVIIETDNNATEGVVIINVIPDNNPLDSAALSDPVVIAPDEIAIKPLSLSSTPDQSAAIAETLDYTTIPWQGLTYRLNSSSELRLFYQQLDYHPLWTDNGILTSLAEQLIHAIAKAPLHALSSERYHSEAFSSFVAGQKIVDSAKLDVLLSDAFITYKAHLSNGIVNPKEQFPLWNKPPRDIDYISLYRHARASNDIATVLVVNDPDYQVLQQAYAQGLKDSQESSFTPIPANSLKVGQVGQAVRILRQRLGLDDSVDVYDEPLKQAVKDYQKDNGLAADGIAGRRTLARLNQSPADNLELLAINMERHRWGQVPTGTYIQVNIPAYKMAVRNGEQYLFESNVIVGRPSRQTPVFTDTMENVVLAPYWNVPKTIFKEDKLPALRRNPNALGSNMQVIHSATGKVVNPASVNWASGGQGYRLRQKPGARNALGRMKFLFPNRHAIYLHDTPNRKLFNRSKRDLSSGCIRVERAEDLAVFLLDEMNYDRTRIQKESRRSSEKWIQLENNKRYPIYLDYFTAWVDSHRVVHYSRDIYGHDKTLKKLYKTALAGK